MQVVFGGGRKNFMPRSEIDSNGNSGYRNDGRNLIREWLVKKESLGIYPKYIYSRKELLNLDNNKYGSVLGLFASDHMSYHLEAGDEEPTLSEMTQKAIEILSQNTKGFVLFVEGNN